MEPDCRSCHTNYHIFEDGFEGTAFNMWAPGFEALYRNRTDNHGVMCIACHGSTHENCMVCHKKSMNTNGQHRNMINSDPAASLVE